MNAELSDALKAGNDRMFHHRKILRRATVLMRIWPEGIIFTCLVRPHHSDDDWEVPSKEVGREVLPWSELPKLTRASATQIADRVCSVAYDALGVQRQQ